MNTKELADMFVAQVNAASNALECLGNVSALVMQDKKLLECDTNEKIWNLSSKKISLPQFSQDYEKMEDIARKRLEQNY